MGGWSFLKNSRAQGDSLEQRDRQPDGVERRAAPEHGGTASHIQGRDPLSRRGKDYLLLSVGCKGQLAGMVGNQTAISGGKQPMTELERILTSSRAALEQELTATQEIQKDAGRTRPSPAPLAAEHGPDRSRAEKIRAAVATRHR